MQFVIRRFLLFVAALFAISVVIFAALRILPGDAASVMAGLNAPPERVAMLRSQLGLNRPLTVQYCSWLGGLLHGDFGISLLTGRSIGSMVAARCSVTFPLIVLGLIVAIAIGLAFGVMSVLTTRSALRSVFHLLGLVGGAIPALWGGLLLILLLGRGTGLLGVLPSQGFPETGWGSFGTAFASLVLPALTVGVISGSSLMRYTRSALGDIMHSGYIDQAMACGYTRREAALKVGLRLTMPQLVSVVGLMFASMITGVMVVENLFALPGIGTGLVTDLGNRDLIAVQSELFMLAAFFLFIGFLVDLLHRFLDPRLRYAVQERA
jgi:peptide/nickel transport system permease protein